MQNSIINYFCCLLLTLLLSANSFCQETENYYKDMAGLNRVIISSKDSVIYASFYRDGDKKINIDDEKHYYWFAQNSIKRTRGGFDGKLLHGDYIVYYINKDLKTKGHFKYGLKYGEWKEWHLGGEIKSKEHWRNGKVVGVGYYYHSNGNIAFKKRFINHNHSEKSIGYDKEGNVISKEHFKNNTLIKSTYFQKNNKGKFVKIKPEKKNTLKSNAQNDTKNKKQRTSKKALKEQPNTTEKVKHKKIKMRIQKFRQILPGGSGA